MLELPCRDGELRYQADFLDPNTADCLFQALLGSLAWQDQVLTDSGLWVALPRAVCWYGDTAYPYAGFTHRPQPWTATLLDLKARVEHAAGQSFNGVLANLYRHGGESMGWHSDQEPILGDRIVIASVSLGAVRRMRFRHNRSGETLELALAHGSLVIMAGSLQQHWQHSIPPMPAVTMPRINLNFRALASGVQASACIFQDKS